MAKRVAKFEKVSFEQFKKDWKDTFGWQEAYGRLSNEELNEIYTNIKLPKRATSGSAGYDFFSPIKFSLAPGRTIKIPTGIRCNMHSDWVMKCYPRSGLGFKYRLQLNNTVGIIDSDYYFSDNEGHIFFKLTNDSNIPLNTLTINAGDGIVQSTFVEYGITEDDDVTTRRNGGFGSTDAKEMEC